jgi:hypothetical protein
MREGRDSKRLLKKAIWGAIGALLSYALLTFIQSPWEEVIPAIVIGAAPGLVDRNKSGALIGALAASIGWLVGAYVSGIILELGLGAWILAGASLGLALGIASRSVLRSLAGLFLGVLAGFLAEAARYISLVWERCRTVDMQLLVLIVAGILLPLVAGIIYKPAEGKAR